jgi:hypothetical protein
MKCHLGSVATRASWSVSTLCKKEKLAHSQSKLADGQLVVKKFQQSQDKVMPWSAQSHIWRWRYEDGGGENGNGKWEMWEWGIWVWGEHWG